MARIVGQRRPQRQTHRNGFPIGRGLDVAGNRHRLKSRL